jgi:sialate O-acetylesterase
MHRPWFALALLVFAAATREAAALELGTPFRDHMVLQREKPVPVWGWADAGDEVTVEFAGQRKTAQAGADGKWMVRLDPLATSATPATLTVTAGRSGGLLAVSDVLVGEVWLGSGQSNMKMTVQSAANFAEEKQAADLPLVRMFIETSDATPEPQARGAGEWHVSSPETVGTFSATLYFFGRELHRALGVPVGLVNSSWGGTPIQSWTDEAAQRKVAELAPFVAMLDRQTAAFDREAERAKYEKATAAWPERARAARAAGKPAPRRPTDMVDRHDRISMGRLFNGKIAPLIPFAIRGAVWYQGEGNGGVDIGGYYRHQLPLLVTDWRGRWQDEFPFAWVQLPNYAPASDGWMLVREAMLESLRLPKTGMAITVDIGEAHEIHPKNKQDVGRRLAAWALADVYGRPVPARSGPLPAGSDVRGTEIVCRFTDADGLRDRDGGEIDGFLIAGPDRQWRPALARIDGTSVAVSAADVSSPAAVRYGWEANPKCDLVNAAGLPASPFRTDTWPLEAPAATKR